MNLKNPFRFPVFAIPLAGLVMSGPISSAGNWPQIFGEMRDGKAAPGGPELLDDEPGKGFKVVWKAEVGDGFAGPVVSGDRVIQFHRQGDEAVIQALRSDNGTEIWKTSYPCDYRDDFGFDPGPRSAPTISGRTVYCYGVEGKITALDLASGEIRWQVDAREEFSAPKGFFGRACAPLVVGDQVLVNCGGRTAEGGAAVISLDDDTGKLLWATGAGGASYSSPIYQIIGDKPVAMFFTRAGVCGIDIMAGKIIFEDPFRPEIEASVSAASPVFCGDRRFFYSASYDLGAGVWQLSEDATSAKKLWSKEGALDCHYSTPLYAEGHLYGFHGRQERGQELRCITADDGSVVWSEPMAPGSLIMADGKLFALTEDGELVIVKATAEKYQELGRGQILRAGTRAYPAFSDGFLYARDKDTLICVDLRK